MRLMQLLQGITPGTVTPVQVGQDVAQIGIDNDSPYDVWVSFGPDTPAAAPGLTVAPLYNGVARSMGTTYLPVPVMQPAFNGVIYLGVYNPAGLAATGGTSTRANIYVSALQEGEAPGAVFAVPRLADMTSQPRIISLPPVYGAETSGTPGGQFLTPMSVAFNMPAANSEVLIGGALPEQGPVYAGFPGTMAQSTQDTWACVIHTMSCYPGTNASAGECFFNIFIKAIDATNNVIGGAFLLPIATGMIGWGANSSFSRPWQMPGQGSINRAAIVIPANIPPMAHFGLAFFSQSTPPAGGMVFQFEALAYAIDISPAPGVAGTLPFSLGSPKYAAATSFIF